MLFPNDLSHNQERHLASQCKLPLNAEEIANEAANRLDWNEENSIKNMFYVNILKFDLIYLLYMNVCDSSDLSI